MNLNFDQNDDDALGILQSNLFAQVCKGFILLLIVVIFWMNPKAEDAEKSKMVPPGSILFEIEWPKEADTDVDLWVQGPDGPAVGYSNKGNKDLNLLRDDLGFTNDRSGENREVTICRGTPVGEYIMNVHLYANKGNYPLPIIVKGRVTLMKKTGSGIDKVCEKEVQLKYLGDEITIVRFKVDQEGNLVADSVNDLQKKIRSTDSSSNAGSDSQSYHSGGMTQFPNRHDPYQSSPDNNRSVDPPPAEPQSPDSGPRSGGGQ